MAEMIAAAARWTTDDGRSWPYYGPACFALSDAPDDIRVASREVPVTDHVMGVRFMFDESSVTVWPIESKENT